MQIKPTFKENDPVSVRPDPKAGRPNAFRGKVVGAVQQDNGDWKYTVKDDQGLEVSNIDQKSLRPDHLQE